MIYIYDILLNFNKNILPFFEWEDEDDIKYARRLPLFKVDSATIYDFLNYQVKISDDFLNSIKNKASFYDEIVKDYSYVTLLSDGVMAIAVSFTKQDESLISTILLDEELEILKQADNMKEQLISYTKLTKRFFSFETRKEQKIKEELLKEIDNLYQNNLIDKLNYCYFEYFNQTSNDEEKVYELLKNSIINNFNSRHLTLHEMIKLSYQNKQNN